MPAAMPRSGHGGKEGVEIDIGLHEAVDLELTVYHLRDRGECQCPEFSELFGVKLPDPNVGDAEVEHQPSVVRIVGAGRVDRCHHVTPIGRPHHQAFADEPGQGVVDRRRADAATASQLVGIQSLVRGQYAVEHLGAQPGVHLWRLRQFETAELAAE